MKSEIVQDIDFITKIKKLISYNNIISISGKSGTGKTTLSLYLVGNLLTYCQNNIESCIWIQASEIFPKKRLSQLFTNTPEKLDYIKNNIYLSPGNKLILSLEEQKKIIHTIMKPSTVLPPSLRYIVVDNISHHLRYSLQHNTDVYNLLNTFYDKQLLPFILFCKREDIQLILIHEVTYSPKSDRIRPFLYSLYDRIEKIDISLHNIFNSNKKKMEISFNKYHWDFQYKLESCGLKII
ncbi:MAG: AAA family ATPase [Promethearchaeota archaeon]